jgi:hypothetical protein
VRGYLDGGIRNGSRVNLENATALFEIDDMRLGVESLDHVVSICPYPQLPAMSMIRREQHEQVIVAIRLY